MPTTPTQPDLSKFRNVDWTQPNAALAKELGVPEWHVPGLRRAFGPSWGRGRPRKLIGVDLTRPTKEIAAEAGCVPNTVYRVRRLSGIKAPRAKSIYIPKSLYDWSSVDWSQQDSHIARDLGCSRERVRQVREASGIAPPSCRGWHEATHRAQRFLESLNGEPITTKEFAERARVSYTVASRFASKCKGFYVPPHGCTKYDWEAMNWDLPNRDLVMIWLDPNASAAFVQVAKMRGKLRKGPSKWSGRSRSLENDPAYLRALAAETKKAGAVQ